MTDCSALPTVESSELFEQDAGTINEVVTSTDNYTSPASDGLPKKTLAGITEDAVNAIRNSGGVPLGDGQWGAGKTYTAYNQYLVFNGVPYKPLSTPYLTQGADPTQTPDKENVQPWQTAPTGYPAFNNVDEMLLLLTTTGITITANAGDKLACGTSLYLVTSSLTLLPLADLPLYLEPINHVDVNTYSSLTLADSVAAESSKNLVIHDAIAASGEVLTSYVEDCKHRIFTDGSTLTVKSGQEVRPEWFGDIAGNIRFAVDILPPTGGSVLLQAVTYPPSYNSLAYGTWSTVTGTGVAGIDYMSKANVSLVGAKMPGVNATDNGLAGGTIIKGPFLIGTGSDFFDAINLGVDSGAIVSDELYAGADVDAFGIIQVSQNTPSAVCKSPNIENIIGLCQYGNLAHGVLVESVSDYTFSNIKGIFGGHGVVIKAEGARGRGVFGRGNTIEGFIVKDNSYARCSDIKVSQISVESKDGAAGAVETGTGVIIRVPETGGMSDILLSDVRVLKKTTCFNHQLTDTAILDTLTVNGLISESCETGVIYAGDVRRSKIYDFTCKNFVTAVSNGTNVASPDDAKQNGIFGCELVNGVDGFISTSKMRVDNITFKNVTGTHFSYPFSGTSYLLGAYTSDGIGSFWDLPNALQAPWTNFGAPNSLYDVYMRDGEIHIKGLIRFGELSNITTLSTQIRPTEVLRFPLYGANAVTVFTALIVSNSGTVAPAETAGANGYYSLDGVSFPIPY